MTFSHSVIIMLASTSPSDPPVLTPSNCSYILLLKEKAVFWQVCKISFFSGCFDSDVVIWVILMVFFKGTFVNNESTSNKINMYSSFSRT